MLEIPLVIVDIQRGGPSTGLPTKTEQSDLNIALYGRHGECPLIVVAAASPSDCFHMTYEAAKLSIEHMTPAIVLSDGYIANGAEPWKVPDLKTSYNKIETRLIKGAKQGSEPYLPYARNEKLARTWAIPGTPGYEHRIGGLEKDELKGNISYDPMNHEKMTHIRQAKIDKIADFIPEQTIEGEKTGDVLVVSWGGTYGATYSAIKELQAQGKKISMAHIKYISPLPRNLGEVLKGFKRIVVPELNNGQMKNLLNMTFQCNAIGYNKIQGLPFKITELIEVFGNHVNEVERSSNSKTH
jgi:2-oxoglutarate ferredoxin oxidoreductase subunit alpha